MKTVIKFNGKEYIEANNKYPRMINKSCKCGNPMYIPIAVIVLGIVEDCAHCEAPTYPQHNHCAAITESYKGLIEDGGEINLD